MAMATAFSTSRSGSIGKGISETAARDAPTREGPPNVSASASGGSFSQLWSGSLPPSRSYPQLIAMPGLHDIDNDHKNALRQLYDVCVPWSYGHTVPHAFWWGDAHPVIELTQWLVNTFYAAILAGEDLRLPPPSTALHGLLTRTNTRRDPRSNPHAALRAHPLCGRRVCARPLPLPRLRLLPPARGLGGLPALVGPCLARERHARDPYVTDRLRAAALADGGAPRAVDLRSGYASL